MRGEDPSEAPPGCKFLYSGRFPYPWGDYCRLLAYIRGSTSPRRAVADVLHLFPLPPVNGPADRLTPFPAAGGYVHLWAVDRGQEARFASILECTPGAVVIWDPSYPITDFPILERAIRQWYYPEEQFGRMEVWRHVPPLPDRPYSPATSKSASSPPTELVPTKTLNAPGSTANRIERP